MHKMKKLLIIFLFITSKLVILANEPPNIIFFLIDDQRYDLLSMLEHPFIQTPNIDKLARNGVYFDEAFVTTSLCSPSRASIVTGQYAHKHNVIDNDTDLNAAIESLNDPIKYNKLLAFEE